MTLKEKIKSYSFWVSLASAIVLILKVIGSKFGFTIDASLASDIITSICSVLVITGIIVTPTTRANADLEALQTKPSIKENIAILSDNLKETADEILNKNTSQDTLEPIVEELSKQAIEEKFIFESETPQPILNQPQPLESIQEEQSIADAQIVIEEPTMPIEENPSTDIVCEDDLKAVLASEKEKWLKNLDAYYQILLEEVKSMKPNE